MKYREFTCLNCGAKGIDMSRTKTKMFCSDNCTQRYYYKRKRGKLNDIAIIPCIYNTEVRCNVHKCGICGWNPKVEKKRKEALGYG